MKAPYLVIVLGFLIGNTNTVLLIPFHRGVIEKELEFKKVVRPKLPNSGNPPDLEDKYDSPQISNKRPTRGLR